MSRTTPAPPSMIVPAVVGVSLVEATLFAVSKGAAKGGAAVMIPVLALVTAPVLAKAGAKLGDPRLAPLLLWALVLKLLGSLLRFSVVTDLYGGVADALGYHEAGRTVGASFRAGDFDVQVGEVVGTGFIKLVTGAIYSVTGPNALVGFLVFSWLGFLGLYFFYRAFCLACPEGDRRRYALLLFFLPSMLFWPSSIGKEAWMLFSLGLAAYGAARLLTRCRGGLLLLGLGLWATAMTRPHVTLMVLLALVVALFLRRSPERSVFGPVANVVAVVALLLATSVVAGRAERLLGVDTLDKEGIEKAIDDAGARTEQGGSAFETSRARSPAQFPQAVVLMLFRPFPFEAHNTQALLASVEGTFLLGCFLLWWRRVLSAPRMMLRLPYVAMACVYSLLFIYAFSSFANFGILTRERIQLFPFVLVVLALPVPEASPRRSEPSPKASRELVG